MGTRRSEGVLDDLLLISARLPWWIPVLLAIASYAAGQYLLSVLFVALAAASAISRSRRRKLLNYANAERNAILDMKWQDFELLLAEAFRVRGYEVTETGGGGADGGVNIVLQRGHEKFLVQCKQWRALKVPVSKVRELYDVMAAGGASGGFVVTSGGFTQEAIDFAQGRNIELVNGTRLAAMLQSTKGARFAFHT